jgi:hypothetical protein
MSEDSTKPESEAKPEMAPKPEPAAETFTADQMEAVKNQIWAEARRKYQKPQPETPKAVEPKPQAPEPASAKTGVYNNWRDIFADATEDLDVAFGKGQRRVLRDSFLAEKPGDPVAWIQERCEAFGIATGEQKQETPKKQELEMSTGKPASDYGAPTSSPVWERPSNPLEWSHEDVERIYALKGRREGQRFIRQKTQEFMKNVVIKLGPDR